MNELERRFAQLAKAFDSELDRFCNHLHVFQGVDASRHGGAWRPPTDIYETRDAVVVKVAVAGLRLPEDAEITVEDNKLIIRGRRRDCMEQRCDAYHHMEINYGNFRREFVINTPFDPDAAQARYENGFLIIALPKTPKTTSKHMRLQVHF